MLLAYRRGLLEPYYDKGIQSYAREELVLGMMAAELEADYVEKMMLCKSTTLAPHLDPKKINHYMGNVWPYLEYASQKREYSAERFKSQEDSLIGSSAQLIKAFKRMKERGIIDQFKKQANELWQQFDKEQQNGT